MSHHPSGAQVLLFPADISWADDVLVQPDLFVVPAEEVTDEWSSIRTLILALEVISPSSARYDRIVKRQLYQEHGVSTYWMVDPDVAMVEIWWPKDERPEIMTDVLRWRVGAGAGELEIELADVFSVPG